MMISKAVHKKALIVDDDPGTRLTMKKMLAGAGFQVVEAQSAGEALQACDTGLPNVILLDVQLPDFSGFEVCQRLRRYYTKQELPILMVTGSADAEDVAYSFTVGANDFVSKPLDRIIFLARVENQVAVSEAQKELEQSRARISRALDVQRAMGDQLPMGIVIEDENGNIVYTNRIFTHWCGDVEPRSLLTSFEWFHGGMFRDQMAQIWNGVHDEKRTGEKFEFSAKKKIISCTCHDIPTRDGTRLWLWSISDLTEQRALEDAASQRIKYDSLGLFASGVAHNFNNLLSGILSASEVLEKKLDRDDERSRRCMKVIKVSVDAGRTLTRKLSAMLRKSDLTDGVMADPTSAVETVIACYQEAAGSAVSFHVSVPDELPPLGIADSNFIDVLANLVSNAVDAVQGEGAVHLGASVSPGGESVLFTVQDSGRGIDGALQGRLFEPFYSTKQLDTKNGVSCTGNGLGLWTVYNLVKASHGEVHISSAKGQGTTVTIELPVVRNGSSAETHSR